MFLIKGAINMTNMFGLVPFVSKKNLSKSDDGFHSLFDIFDEPFFNNLADPPELAYPIANRSILVSIAPLMGLLENQ